LTHIRSAGENFRVHQYVVWNWRYYCANSHRFSIKFLKSIQTFWCSREDSLGNKWRRGRWRCGISFENVIRASYLMISNLQGRDWSWILVTWLRWCRRSLQAFVVRTFSSRLVAHALANCPDVLSVPPPAV
jgi:hypothetical protein